jgi:hypothetical protein
MESDIAVDPTAKNPTLVSKLEVWKQFFRLGSFFIQSKTLAGIQWGSEAKQKEVKDKYVFSSLAKS